LLLLLSCFFDISLVRFLLLTANCFCNIGAVQFYDADDKCKKYGECYHLSSFALPLESAEYACEGIGGHLSDIYSEKKANFLRGLHLSTDLYPFWVGLHCETSSLCSGARNYTFDTNNYENWCVKKAQPNFNNGNCVYEDYCSETSYGWFTAECDDIITDHYFSCQTDACSISNFCSQESQV
uniref:C-type lectin domain-containing protein n=1 Tax=Syphacia muris TaxID=451379 RepID=A0A0N5ACI2_9BILA